MSGSRLQCASYHAGRQTPAPASRGSTTMSVLNELQEAVAAVATSVGPSVVGIAGRVLTNAHNLRGGEVTVRFAGGRTAVGTAKGVDWDGDLAVIEVDTAGAPAIAWSTGSATIGSA